MLTNTTSPTQKEELSCEKKMSSTLAYRSISHLTQGMKLQNDKDDIELPDKNLSHIPSASKINTGSLRPIWPQVHKSKQKFL